MEDAKNKWATRKLALTIGGIVAEYRHAKKPNEMINILADQCDTEPCRIAWLLKRCGMHVDPNKLPRKLRNPESFDYVAFWEKSEDAAECDRIRATWEAAGMTVPEPEEPTPTETLTEKKEEREEKDVEKSVEKPGVFEKEERFIERLEAEYGVRQESGIEKRREILADAGGCVCADRNLMYGEPEDSFAVIAKLWSDFLGVPITAADAVDMMILFKVARNHGAAVRQRDTYVDIAGYAACGGGMME